MPKATPKVTRICKEALIDLIPYVQNPQVQLIFDTLLCKDSLNRDLKVGINFS